MSTQRLDPDGQWRPATPIPYDLSSVDYEVYGSGPYRWEAFIGDEEVGRGRARTRLGLRLALDWHQRRMRRQGRLAQTPPPPTCPAQTGPVWKDGGEPCGCVLPAGHDGDHECSCGGWFVDSVRRDEGVGRG